MTPTVSHADLVVAAARWLRRRGCGVVLTEHHGGTLEVPDAIGFRGVHSIQVECKVSRRDFWADRKKACRRFERTTGEHRLASERWYLTPPGLLSAADLPADWGWMEYGGTRVRLRKPAPIGEMTEHVRRAQVTRLFCELRRYQAQGIRYKTMNELQAAPGGEG